jgi:hypothetical protein
MLLHPLILNGEEIDNLFYYYYFYIFYLYIMVDFRETVIVSGALGAYAFYLLFYTKV